MNEAQTADQLELSFLYEIYFSVLQKDCIFQFYHFTKVQNCCILSLNMGFVLDVSLTHGMNEATEASFYENYWNFNKIYESERVMSVIFDRITIELKKLSDVIG